jgi:hypothetical protein
LPGKHSSRPVGLARLSPTGRLATLTSTLLFAATRRRAALVRRRHRSAAAAVVLVLLVGGSIWALTTRRPPLPLFVGQPVVPVVEAVVTAEPTPAPATSFGAPITTSAATGTGEPRVGVPVRSEAGRTTRPAAPPDLAKPSPIEARTGRPAAPTGALAARYVVSSSWETGFVGGVLVTNPTGAPLSWRVVVSHDPGAGVRVTTTWNADLTRSGSTAVFTGGPLAPGASQTFGFEATKQVTGSVRPTDCTVNGVACSGR